MLRLYNDCGIIRPLLISKRLSRCWLLAYVGNNQKSSSQFRCCGMKWILVLAITFMIPFSQNHRRHLYDSLKIRLTGESKRPNCLSPDQKRQLLELYLALAFVSPRPTGHFMHRPLVCVANVLPRRYICVIILFDR
jgi:hypothetical protein